MDPNIGNSKSDFYQTPRLEQFAASGMRFSNGYSAAPICSPTRAALLTGQSPAQLNMTDLPASEPGNGRWTGHYDNLPLTPPVPEPLRADAFTLPQIIKQANPNYVTAHYGKWHLSDRSGLYPLDMGYDQAWDLSRLPSDEVDPWGVFAMANAASDFMQEQVANDAPFYLQLSHRSVHEPIRSRQEIRDKYANLPPGDIHNNIEYAAMTEDLDTSVGMVLDMINQLGIADNTYVIYTSDNGAPIGASRSWPLSRGKATVKDGGIRVPFIINGPGIEANTFSSVPVTTVDLFATFANLAGRTEPMPSQVEGASLLPILHNGGELPAGMDHLSRNFHEGGELYWHWPHNFGPTRNSRIIPSSAMRDGDYKIFVQYGENGAPDTVNLFNITTDTLESVDLSASMPEKKAEMLAKLNNYLAAVDASFAYDVKAPATMNWDAGKPGSVADEWRSTIDLKYKGRETWTMGAGNEAPQVVRSGAYQPGIAQNAFRFDGNDVMRRQFFQVGDDGPRRTTAPSAGVGDFDRSATMQFWVKLDSLTNDQVLFETGDGQKGLSLSFGDNDADGKKNDLRFRLLGLTGADQGGEGMLKELVVNAKIDRFANPVADFVHLAAVYNDDPADRYAEIYVNGALAGRAQGELGTDKSLMWDGYDSAGLGNMAGSGLGAAGGEGSLPFTGGFRGSIASMRFQNFAVDSNMILKNYNDALYRVGHGIASFSGQTTIPGARPADVSHGQFESNNLSIVQERSDVLKMSLDIDALIGPQGGLVVGSTATEVLPAGTKFSSYLLQFDPTTNGSGLNRAQGSIDFTGKILAVLWEPSTLAATDSILGSIGNYGVMSHRGFDPDSQGALVVSTNLRTLDFDLLAQGNEMLQFRVLTTGIDPADFNADGRVNAFDLSIWQRSFGVDAGGDADGDGDTDGRDFLIWQQQQVPMLPPTPDFNRDQVVDELDLTRWQQSYGLHSGGDADGDGDTDGRDFLLWQRQFRSVSADFNRDGFVDQQDLTTWQQSYGVNFNGDADYDGDTDGRDFLFWQRAFTPSVQATIHAVPEPITWGIAVGFAALFMAGCRKRVSC